MFSCEAKLSKKRARRRRLIVSGYNGEPSRSNDPSRMPAVIVPATIGLSLKLLYPTRTHTPICISIFIARSPVLLENREKERRAGLGGLNRGVKRQERLSFILPLYLLLLLLPLLLLLRSTEQASLFDTFVR